MFGIVFLVYCGFKRVSVKLFLCLSKENCLYIGLFWWGIKGIIGFSYRCSNCGYFKVWSIYKVVVELYFMDIIY